MKKIDKWKVIKQLGIGGSGIVYEVKSPDGVIYALKKLKPDSGKEKTDRFLREVKIASDTELSNKGIIIPIIEQNLKGNDKYYVLPLATELKNIEFPNLKAKCDAILQVLYRLKYFHSLNMAHRDIKPENILYYNGNFYLSDLGLLYIATETRITKEKDKERIGARRTIAPEMERSFGYNANPYKADIYSMAKTVWMILTGDFEGFEGQYTTTTTISLSEKHIGYLEDDGINRQEPYLTPLDILLNEATDNDPLKRPSIKEFIIRFNEWIKINSNYHIKNNLEWQEIIGKLFPISVPSKVEWTNIHDIIYILNFLCQYKSLAYMFLPVGGQHFRNVKAANEVGFIEVDVGVPYLFPVKSLTFYSIQNSAEWSFFRMDFNDKVKPCFLSINGKEQQFDEELTELEPAYYGPLEVYEENEEYLGFSPTRSMRYVCRYYRGACVLFNTRSPYNLEVTTHGRHSLFTKDEFEFYINGCSEGKFSLICNDNDILEIKHLYAERIK